MAAKALVSTVAWPVGTKWDAFLDRVSASWEGRLKFIRDDKSLTPEGRAKQREVEAEKQDKRSLEIEDINAKPLHVRWIVNHLARRAWRGTQFLQQDLARHQARVDKLIRLDYLEERYGPDSFEFKAQLRRVNLGEATEQTLKAFFPGYSKLDEADIGLSDVATSRVGNVDDENPHTGDQ